VSTENFVAIIVITTTTIIIIIIIIVNIAVGVALTN
jgi:hypothetical protein